MPTATILFQPRPHYRLDSFARGVERHGFKVQTLARGEPGPGDLLIVWNRMHGRSNKLAEKWLAAGASVLVAENGYIGSDGNGEKLFALAWDHHQGAGRWRIGDADRWKQQSIPIMPWRTPGRQIVLLPQRGLGEPGIAMPREWDISAFKRLRQVTDRPIHIRKHPGAIKYEPYEDFADALCAVTWASGAAIKAICYGVPVLYELSNWIGAPGATHIDCALTHGVENCLLTDDAARENMLHRLSWAQWSVSEIESGEAFAWLMDK